MFVLSILRHVNNLASGVVTNLVRQFRIKATEQLSWKFILGISLICILAIVIVYVYLYTSLQRKYQQPMSLEGFMSFVRSSSNVYALEQELKEAQTHESIGESITRTVLEDMFRPHMFPKVRLDYIINPVTGAPLEFDCYCDDLKLAVEYNGVQHYKFVPFFHKTMADFHNMQYRDRIKSELCDQYGIKLVSIPYTVRSQDIAVFIAMELGYNNP